MFCCTETKNSTVSNFTYSKYKRVSGLAIDNIASSARRFIIHPSLEKKWYWHEYLVWNLTWSMVLDWANCTCWFLLQILWGSFAQWSNITTRRVKNASFILTNMKDRYASQLPGQVRHTTWGNYFSQWSSVSHSQQSPFQRHMYRNNVSKFF